MKNLLQSFAFGLLLLALPASAALKVGDPAPDFTLTGSDGKNYRLSDLRGKQGAVIAWFPKAFTGGCTAECKSLRENGGDIPRGSVALFAASTDDAATNKKFAESLSLDYPILSDPSKATAKAYGVLNPTSGLAQRWTFYIDKSGRVAHIDQAVQPSSHGKAVADQIKRLGLDR